VAARGWRGMNYAELQVTTHFSLLRGASSAEELFSAAALLGIKALGVVDRNSLAGMVRAHVAAGVTGVRLIVGCRLDLQCRTSLLVYRPSLALSISARESSGDGCGSGCRSIVLGYSAGSNAARLRFVRSLRNFSSRTTTPRADYFERSIP
jgi:hypothetical protein